MVNAMDFLQGAIKHTIYEESMSTIDFLFNHSDIDLHMAERLADKYIEYLVNKCDCVESEREEVLDILIGEVKHEKLNKELWG